MVVFTAKTPEDLITFSEGIKVFRDSNGTSVGSIFFSTESDFLSLEDDTRASLSVVDTDEV